MSSIADNLSPFLEVILGLTIIIFVLMAAIYASLETSITSINIIRLREKLNLWNTKKAEQIIKVMKKLTNNYSSTISTIAICNNIAVLFASTLSGLFFVSLLKNADVGDGVSLGILTVILIVFGEIIPKHFARNNPEFIAVKLYKFIIWGMYFLYPILYLSHKILKTKIQVTATEKELKEIIKKVKSEGIIEDEEQTLIIKALEFDDTIVKDVYTKWRSIIFEYENKLTAESIVDYFSKHYYNRLPVINEKLQPVGIIKLHTVMKKIVPSILENKKIDESLFNFKLNEMIDACPIINSEINLSEALNIIQPTRAKCAFVQNKRNEIIGMIFASDLISQIFGNFYNENVYNNKYAKISHNKYIVTSDCRVNYFAKNNKLVDLYTGKNYCFGDWVKSINNNKILGFNNKINYKKYSIKSFLNYHGEVIYELTKI